ncbi:serine/threonine-protein kinase [Kitasatospora sp. NPDC059146]|uniref:serine/threonine-protein kinase n=1 Tax=Kitasatospora sp. NPDC059146 TaxID=3346741 RepID=UPI0036C7F916
MSIDVIADRYELLQNLSVGEAQVWAGHDRLLDRKVALKLTRASRAHAAVRGRFAREAEVMMKLHGLRIPEVYQVGAAARWDDARVDYMAMEYVPGATVDALAEELRRLPVSQAVALAASTAQVLEGVHAREVVHRDIKPSNLILDRTGAVTLIDFGISVCSGRVAVADLRGEGITGSPSYMAPEQLADDLAAPSADVYSLGVVLFRLLTGQVPFEAEVASPLELLEKKVNETPKPPSSYCDDIPDGLDSLVLRMLDRRPDARPSAAEVGEALVPFTPPGSWILSERLYPGHGTSALEVRAPIQDETFTRTRPVGGAADAPLVSSAPLSSLGITGQGELRRLQDLRRKALLLRQSSRKDLRDDSESFAGQIIESEEIEAAHSSIDGALARLFVRLGPPPEPTNNLFANLGSDGGGAQK